MNQPQPNQTVLATGEASSGSGDRLLELLVQWEEKRASGESVSAEQLCPDDLRLQTELRERILRREKILAALELSPDEGSFAGQRGVGVLPKLDGYEIIELIGQGGMGVVYKARQLGLNRLIAIKMIQSGINASPQELARFRREAEAVARLAHPNIVQIFEIGEQNGCPFLSLEFVSGGTLAQQIDGTALPPRRVADMLFALAKGVQHAHERGIVHRDLKPGNVLIHADGTPKIADFGLAKHAATNPAHTMTGAIIGSPTYMAPEQAAGNSAEITPATDVYALGVILYEMLTGRPPFKGDSVIETIQQVREQDPLPPRLVQPKIPRDLETICLKCLEKKPQNRYANAAALARDLHAFLHNEPIHAQSLTILDQVARTISHHGFDERIRGFANWMLCFSPIPVILHSIAFALLVGKPYYATGMIATTSIMFFTLLPLLIGSGMPSLRDIPTWQRKHFLTTWISHLISIGVVLAVVLLVVPADQPNLRLIVYPLWAICASLGFLAHAVEAGFYYVVGAAMFFIAILLALTPTWAPLEVSLFMSCNMFLQGVYLRRQSGEPTYTATANAEVAAATTVIPPAGK
jgi:serine/threonine protein kinase